MTANAEKLDSLWRELPPPPDPTLEARAVGSWPGGQLLAAVDADRHRHLLVAVPDQPRTTIARLRGMDTAYRQLKVAGDQGIWLDLQLVDEQGEAAFTLMSADIVAAAGAATEADPAVIAEVVRRWRRFWSSVPDGMDKEARLGLFGELWLLTRWLPAITPTAVTNWRGPLGGRHDFANTHLSVEVKASSVTTGPLVHRINSLTQLAAPDQGHLYLLSLRVIPEPTGTDSLDKLIAEAREHTNASGGTAVDDLDERLAAYGWTPVHRGRYNDPLKVLDQTLYRVDTTFPRLTPEALPDLPAGVVDIRYSLDTTVCAPWKIGDAPVRPGPLDRLCS